MVRGPNGAAKRGVLSKNTAYIFNIGRELLEGLVLDRNANFMASQISDAGYRVRGIQVLDDGDEASVVAAFQAVLQQQPGYVFTTGGMGPGHDDITRQCIAKAVDLPLEESAEAAEMVRRCYRRLYAKGVVRDAELNESRMKMTVVPQGGTPFENPIGTAPAIKLEVGPTTIFLLPGAPTEMQQMFGLFVLPALKADHPGTHKMARHVEYPGRDESVVARMLADLSRRYHGLQARARLQGDEGSLGIRITLFAEHGDEAELDQLLSRAEADLRARLGLEVPLGSSGEATAE